MYSEIKEIFFNAAVQRQISVTVSNTILIAFRLAFKNENISEYDFKVISINMDSPRSMSKVKKYVKSSKYEFDVLVDPRMSLFKKMGGSIMPFVVVVDNKGVVTNKHIGYNLGDEVALEEEIKVLISFNQDSSIVK